MSKILDFVRTLKREYEKEFGSISYNFTNDKSCVQRWAEELGDEYYLKVLSNLNSRQKDKFVIFKYIKFEVLFTRDSSIDYSGFWDIYDGIYRECRGVIVDIEKECLVTLPFDKFFGINEREETSEKNLRIIMSRAKQVQFTDKLDGSIIIARNYENNIIASSSGMLEGSSILENAYSILNTMNYHKLLYDYKDFTCMFESVHPNDMHIVSYAPDMYGLHLIGMRSMATGELKPYSEIVQIANDYGVMTTEYYKMGFDDILKDRANYKAEEKEGYVMYVDGLLVKIKCDDYILMHKMWKTKCSMNGLIQAIYLDRIDDVMQGIPDNFKKTLEEGIKKIAEYERLMEKAVLRYEAEAPKDRIEFFKWVKTIPKHIQRYVTNRYLGNSISYLVLRDDGKQVQYMKYSEIEKRIEELKGIEAM